MHGLSPYPFLQAHSRHASLVEKQGRLKFKLSTFQGEAQPLRYAKMRDRLLVGHGKKQLYGTQVKLENLVRELYPVKDPGYVDKRREEIGLGPLKPYLKPRFDIDWQVVQKE